METRSNHILVGGVVLALLAATVIFIVWLSQVTGEDTRRFDIFFRQAVDGLNKGSAVTFSGVPVGQIESINLEPRTPEFVRVRISVRADTPVAQGSTATIQGVGFTGVSQIQLDAAPRGAPSLRCPDEDAEAQCPYGVPVIPTKPGALGQLLSSAPELLDRVSALVERLSEVLDEDNQRSIAGILANLNKTSGAIADRSPEIAATLAETRIAVQQIGVAATQIGELADASNKLLDEEGRPLTKDLRETIQSANRTVTALEGVLNDASPTFDRLNKQTLPEVSQLIRDLQQTSAALRSITTRIDQEGAGALLGSRKLPEYKGE